eukprot:gene5177-3724_t
MVQENRVDPAWITKATTAITSRDGVYLKDAIVDAVEGTAAVLHNDSSSAIGEMTDLLYRSVEDGVSRIPSPTPLSASNAVSSSVEKEHRHLIEAVVRAAVTGALAKYQETHGVIFRVEASEMEKEEPSNEELVKRTVHNTLLRGMLYAFEAFQEEQKTKGTVGWDTLVLLYFVHLIPKIAREASGCVVDEATGEVVRQWRKLLIALQSADAHEQPEHSRRRGTLSIVNGLLMILFSRYNTHQCNVLVSAVEHAEKGALQDSSKSILQPSQHMTSEIVTYYYFKGRLELYNHRFEEALTSLRHAYRLLPPFSFRVRFYLCIAALINGKMIPDAVLDEDNIIRPMLSPLIASIQRGDYMSFHLALETFSATFRRRGVYLLLQQCKHLCTLMLLSRVHGIIASLGSDNSRVPFAALVEAQKVVMEEGSTTTVASPAKRKEQEDILALHHTTEEAMALSISHLIARGYVRGYLSYEHRTLVLSKALPFPTLV